MDVDEAIADSQSRIGRSMSDERLAWFRELTRDETPKGLRVVPGAMMKELVDEIVRLRRREALDRLAIQSQELGLPY